MFELQFESAAFRPQGSSSYISTHVNKQLDEGATECPVISSLSYRTQLCHVASSTFAAVEASFVVL